jgi:hypothetical protein
MVSVNVTTTGEACRESGTQKLSRFSLEVDQTNGSGASWVINLEGSMDGAKWTPILTHSNLSPGDTQIESLGAGSFPCLWRRVNVISISLGSNTNLAVKYEGMP